MTDMSRLETTQERKGIHQTYLQLTKNGCEKKCMEQTFLIKMKLINIF